MSTSPTTDLFGTLPSVYRIRDSVTGGVLQNLFAILQDAHDTVDADIAQMYENWFIETCAEWVVPYLADLLGTAVLQSSNLAGITLRSYVASTLSYRRRKGTTVVLEQLARDITNWPAVAVEGYTLLATTQYMQHLRPTNIATLDLRNSAAVEAIGSAWDTAARTVDIRGISDASISSLAQSGDPASGIHLRGKPNLNNVAIFLWRIGAFAISNVTPRAVSSSNDGRYRFHPVGIDIPLYGHGTALPQFTQPSGPQDIPAELVRRSLAADLESLRQSMVDNGTVPGVAGAATYLSTYFGADPVLKVIQGTLPIPAEQISICDLSDVDSAGNWRTLPTWLPYKRASDGSTTNMPITVCVDPALGRLAFPSGAPTSPLSVDYSYGFSGQMGGGPYDRTASLRTMMQNVDPTDPYNPYWATLVDLTGELAGAQDVYSDLDAAINAWNALGAPPQAPAQSATPTSSYVPPQLPPHRFGVIVLPDSRTYNAPTVPIQLPERSSLLIVGATWPSLQSLSPNLSYAITAEGCRPHIFGDMQIVGTAPSTSDNPGTLLLNGLLIEGSILVNSGNLGSLQLAHCTIVPSFNSGGSGGSIQVSADPSGLAGLQNTSLKLQLSQCISGPFIFPDNAGSAPSISVTDSILDAAGGEAIHAREADATLSGCTVIGSVGLAKTIGLRTLSASNCIFTGIVNVERVQSGCMRYSYLTPDTVSVPRRFRCQPDLATASLTSANAIHAVESRLTPSFTNTQYGDPAYAQLSATCAPEIRAGADDGSEMGAFGFLKQPQRDANLRSVLPDYLRPSFRAGIFYMS